MKSPVTPTIFFPAPDPVPTDDRVTESGESRVTENGEQRITETKEEITRE